MGDPLARDLAVLRFSPWEWGRRAGLRPWPMFVLFQYTDLCLMIIEIRRAFFLLFAKDYRSAIDLMRKKTRLQITQTVAAESFGT